MKPDALRVRISDIPPRGLEVKHTLPLDPLNVRLMEGSGSDILFTQPPYVELLVQKTLTGAEAKGGVRTAYSQPCSLCLDKLPRPAEIPLDLIFKKISMHEIKSADDANEFEDDIGVSYFAGDHIELEELIQEIIILSLDIFWHPPRDKKGNCETCGRNPMKAARSPASTTLGSLLAKAQKK